MVQSDKVESREASKKSILFFILKAQSDFNRLMQTVTLAKL